MTKKLAGFVLLLALVAGGYGCHRYELEAVATGPNIGTQPVVFRLDKGTGEVCVFATAGPRIGKMGCSK